MDKSPLEQFDVYSQKWLDQPASRRLVMSRAAITKIAEYLGCHSVRRSQMRHSVTGLVANIREFNLVSTRDWTIDRDQDTKHMQFVREFLSNIKTVSHMRQRKYGRRFVFFKLDREKDCQSITGEDPLTIPQDQRPLYGTGWYLTTETPTWLLDLEVGVNCVSNSYSFMEISPGEDPVSFYHDIQEEHGWSLTRQELNFFFPMIPTSMKLNHIFWSDEQSDSSDPAQGTDHQNPAHGKKARTELVSGQSGNIPRQLTEHAHNFNLREELCKKEPSFPLNEKNDISRTQFVSEFYSFSNSQRLQESIDFYESTRTQFETENGERKFKKMACDYITSQIARRTEKFQYGDSQVYILQMPQQSCAQTGLELLTGNPDNVVPMFQLNDQGESCPYTSQLATSAEISNIWKGERATIGGKLSTGIFLSSEEQGFAIRSDPRDLRKYLDKHLRSGNKFAAIYQFKQTSTANHCLVISNKPIVFGQNYTIDKLRKKCKGASKPNQKRRTQEQAAIKLIQRCLLLESADPPHTTQRTEKEIDFALQIEKALILKSPLPQPFAVKSGLGATILTRMFKAQFPHIWIDTDEKNVIIRTSKYEKASQSEHLQVPTHGKFWDMLCGNDTLTGSARQDPVTLTMAQVRQSGIPEQVIYNIHNDTVAHPRSQKDGKNKAAIETTHSYSQGEWNHSCTAYYQGYAPQSFQSFIPFIPGVTLEQLTDGRSNHQAHPSLRFLADHFHAQALGDFGRSVKRGSHGVIVGSKYKKDFKRALDMFDLPVDRMLSIFPVELQKAVKRGWFHSKHIPQDAGVRNRRRLVALPATAHQMFTIMENGTDYQFYQTWEDFQVVKLLTVLWDVAEEVPEDLLITFIQMIYDFPRTPIHLTALRPNLNDYDKTYNLQNMPPNRQFQGGWMRRITVTIREQKLEDFMRMRHLEANRPPTAYLLLDVTYYLRETFTNAQKHGWLSDRDTAHYASATFHTMPGEYTLPWCSGTVVVENRLHRVKYGPLLSTDYIKYPQRITQSMTGAGKSYTHENNYIDNQPTAKCATGWFSYEHGSCQAKELKIKAIMSTLSGFVLSESNAQTEYFRNFKQRLLQGSVPMKTLASTLPEHHVNKTIVEVLADPHHCDTHAGIQRNIGHLLVDPSKAAPNPWLEGKIIDRTDCVAHYLEAKVAKSDRIRHPLACHGNDEPHHRKEVREMAKRVKVKKWMTDFKKDPKIKREKGPMVEEKPMDTYYRSKLPNSEILSNPHPEVVVDEETRRNLVKLDTFIEQKTLQLGPCGYCPKRKDYIPMQSLNKNKLCTKMSFSTKTEGVEYEFSTKSVQNKTAAICRLLSGRVIACNQHKRQFQDMCKRYWKYLDGRLKIQDIPAPNFLDYPEKFSSGKRDIYLKQIISQLAGSKIPENWIGTAMVKSGEVYLDDKPVSSHNFDTTENRPRLIANPSRTTLGLPQAISNHVQHTLADKMPEFICGLNLKELASVVQSSDHLSKVICVDGSSFDSNQHEWIQRAVQGPLWDKVMKNMEPWLSENNAASPVDTAKQLSKHFSSYKNFLFAHIPGINSEWTEETDVNFRKLGVPPNLKKDYLPLLLHGTTFSGHSFRTTVGNTLNSIFQTFYYIEQSGVREPWKDN